MSLMQMSFSGAVIILAIIIVRALAINKLPKKVFVLLWEVVLLRLLIPFSIPSVLSAYSLVGKSEPIQEALTDIPAGNVIVQLTAGQMNRNPVTDLPMQNEMADISIWPIIWIAGIILCGIFFAVSYVRCYFEFRISLPVRNGFTEKWLAEHQLRRIIQIRQSDRISTPLTYGIFHPVILMPKKTDWENSQQLQYVLLHEYTHICRFDMVLKLIAIFALCIHWFNPLVWVMYILFNRDIELSCDESVVRQFGETSKSIYARTLITMEEKKSGLTPLYNSFSRNAIEERITAIMKTKKITIGVLIISVVVILAIVVLFATSASGERENMLPDSTVEGDANESTNVSDEESDASIEVPKEGQEGIIGDVEETGTALEMAKEVVAQKYADMKADIYCNWIIDRLEHVYTYEELEGCKVTVYQLNYKFLAQDPEKVVLTGGMTMDEAGWVVPEYPNSTYLALVADGDALSYLVLMENDCFPGDEVFTEDLRQLLKVESVAIAGYLKEITEDSVIVDIVEFVTDDDTARKEELIRELNLVEGNDLVDGNFLDGYYIYNPDEETVEWKLTDEPFYIFVDWNHTYTNEGQYTTRDRAIFEEYLGTYENSQPGMPFFFWVTDGVVTTIEEEPLA